MSGESPGRIARFMQRHPRVAGWIGSVLAWHLERKREMRRCPSCGDLRCSVLSGRKKWCLNKNCERYMDVPR